MDLRISGKRALITGATGGLGHETCRFLAAEGATLFLSDLDRDLLSDVAQEFGADFAAADVSTTNGCDGLVNATGTDFDIWVHAIGVTGAKGDPLQMDDAAWDSALNVDFLSAVRLA